MLTVTPLINRLGAHGVSRPFHAMVAFQNTPMRSRPLNACEKPKNKIVIARRLFLIVYILSFVPYLMPYEVRPELYRDGLTTEQIAEKRRYRELGMDLSKAPFTD